MEKCFFLHNQAECANPKEEAGKPNNPIYYGGTIPECMAKKFCPFAQARNTNEIMGDVDDNDPEACFSNCPFFRRIK